MSAQAPRGDVGRIYRRRIRLEAAPGRVVGDLEDDPHHFRVVLHHDGERVTRAEGEAVRYPWTTCPGAVEPLRALEGMPLSARCTAIGKHADATRNCTHMFDLAGLAVAHAAAGRNERQYDCAVWDGENGVLLATLDRDGARLLGWRAREGLILAPERFAGVALQKRFMAWAEENLEPELAEAAIVLRRAVFISASRSFDGDAVESAARLGHMLGRCHTFDAARVEQALRVKGSGRDFTDTPERMLSRERE